MNWLEFQFYSVLTLDSLAERMKKTIAWPFALRPHLSSLLDPLQKVQGPRSIKPNLDSAEIEVRSGPALVRQAPP